MKITGFIAEEAKNYIGEINHEFHRGKILPVFIDEIGGDIDFVLLDTVHWFLERFLIF